MSKKIIFGIIIPVVVAAIAIFVLRKQPTTRYYHNEGFVFGTYYNIRYKGTKDMEASIQAALQKVDQSLSMFNVESTISRINRNEPDVQTDSLFEVMYKTAKEVSVLSNGAFDITVRPLVNLWGFGNNKHQANGSIVGTRPTQSEIDSIQAFVGYELITLTDHRLLKKDNRTTIDASAIAKGFGVDVVANLLANSGCENYLVDIGGEVVAEGLNDKHIPWRVGISKPADDPDGTNRDLEEIISTTHIAMATSGNYRQYYQDGDIRRSHTIDPRTGTPVEHSLLSATVTASSCMRADALATACMVLGTDDAITMIEQTADAACFLIYATPDGTETRVSSRWNQ